MKIAVVTQYFPTAEQPWAGHSAFQTLKHLSSEHQIKVFYPDAQYPRLLTPRSKKHRAANAPSNLGGMAFERIPYPTLPLIGRPMNGWSIFRKMLRSMRAFDPDLILNYVVYPDGFAALRLAKKLNKPVVLTAIGSDINRISDRFSAIYTKKALREANFVTTVSTPLKQRAIHLGSKPDTTAAILNGCDTAIFHPSSRQHAREQLGLPADAELAVYVGRTDYRKGLIELVDALTNVKKTRPAVQCVLIGDGPDKPLVQARIQEHAAEGWIKFVPPCSSLEVSRWMAAADIVTLPSYNEGCPNVVVEALCAGRPVVATHVGGIPELVRKAGGILVPPKDTGALTQAFLDAFHQSWDADMISAQFSRSWADVAEDLESTLIRTLHSSSS